MSQDIICHFSPTGGVDERIANLLNNGYSKEDIAALRGLYDMDNRNKPLFNPAEENVFNKTMRNKKELPDDWSTKILEGMQKLMEYKNRQDARHLAELKNATAHMAKTFAQLYNVEGWDVSTRRNRINMVVADFMAEVTKRFNKAQKDGLSLSRQQIVNGYKANGRYYHGQQSIFESIFNQYFQTFKEALEVVNDDKEMTDEERAEFYSTMTPEEIEEDKEILANNYHIVEEYPKILKNWAALCAFARMSLRDTEGLKLGLTHEYAAPTTSDNFTIDSPLEDNYDLEESVRDAWMIHQNELSAFGSLGSEVRRFLATITDVDDNGERMKDDLGYYVKMNPIEMHTYLGELLRGITTESGLLRKLYSLSSEDPKLNAVFKALTTAAKASLTQKDAEGNTIFRPIEDNNKPQNPVILTQLLEDMHKNFISYTALVRSKFGNIIAKLLNRQANPLEDEYLLRMALNEQLDATSVYDEEGNMNWENYAKWAAEIKSMLPQPDENASNIFDQQKHYGNQGFWGLNRAQKVDFMVRMTRAVGIPLSENSAKRILNNNKHRNDFLEALEGLRSNPIQAAGDMNSPIRTLISYWMPEGKKVTREQYNQALEQLNNRKNEKGEIVKVSWDTFRELKQGNQNEQENSPGAGNEKINKLLGIVADVSERLKLERRVPWFDRKGKANSRFSDRTPSYMGDLVDKLHEFVNEGDEAGLKSFIEDKWGQSTFFCYDKSEKGKYKFYNRWIQELYDSIYRDTKGIVHINTDALAKVFQFDEFLGSNIDRNVTTFENFTEKQHAEAMLKQFLQPRGTSSKSKLAKYPCFILGDSGAQMFFTAKRYSHDEILAGLRDVFAQELEHQNYVQATNNILKKFFADQYGYTYKENAEGDIVVYRNGAEITDKALEELGYRPIANFSETRDEFTTLTFLNSTFKDGKYWKMLTGESEVPIDKKVAMKKAVAARNTDALTRTFEVYMADAIAEFKHKLASVGVLAEVKGEDGVTKYTDPKGYFSKDLKLYKNDVEEMINDFFWNTKYATIEQLQLFTIDPAYYDHRYPIKDLQKRYKEIYAPGKGVSVEARDYNGNLYVTKPYESAVYFDDIEVSSKDVNPYFFKLMQKTFGENHPFVQPKKGYNKNTLTDGQGYRTLESYRAVRGMAGEWTRIMEEAYQKIQSIRKSGRELTQEDIREIANLAVVFQPIKPYLYTLEKLDIGNGDMALIPVQHKYAEIVLIPELLNDGKLRDMALWMENHKDSEGRNAPIDLIASTKCVKVGAFGSVALKGINDTEGINNALDKAFVHNLAWADYRIQSGVPEHLNHAQLFGTQIRKLILANIVKDKDYNYLSRIMHTATNDPRGLKVNIPGFGDTYLNGRKLIAFYNSLIMANLFDSYNDFENSAATNQKISDRMIQNVISNSNQSEDNAFGFSIIDEGDHKGEFVVPLGEPGMEHDASALLWSLFKKAVNKQRIKGGSAVQASALGLSGRAQEVGDLFEVVSPDGDNVLYDEIEMPWSFSYRSATGRDVALRFEDWCNLDGTLKVCDGKEGRPLRIVHGEDALEYLSWPVSGRDEFGRAKDESQGYYVPLIEDRYRGILDIIAYRIPTERDYSMINCKVFRFSNPLAGGTMKVPSSRTTTAGFDFDIDKLYFFMREFAQTHLSEQQIEEVWSNIYGLQYDKDGRVVGGNAIYRALVEARNRDSLGKDIVDVASGMFKKFAGMDTLNQNLEARGRLFYYWEAAGLEGTPEEAFTKYLEEHRDKYPVFDTYDLSASPLNPVIGEGGEVVTKGNSRIARNNMLLDLMRQRLMDKETLKARYTPGGFDNNREAALTMRVLQFADRKAITKDGRISWDKVRDYVERINKGELKDPEPEYDPSDPTAILVYNQQNQVAGKLIGIFANQNTNHVYASTMHALELTKAIKFGNHTTTGLYDLLHAPEGVDVDTNMAEYLAASVDAVKDPVLNFLNLNTTTADAGSLLARIGYTPMEIGLLLNQPIIRALCEYKDNNGVGVDQAINQMLKEYGSNVSSFKKFKFDASQVTTDRLADNILHQRSMADSDSQTTNAFRQGQLQVLWLFNEIQQDARDLNSFVQCTKFTAANSIGSTWGDQIAQEMRVADFIDRYTKPHKNKEQNRYDTDTEEFDADGGQRFNFVLFDPNEMASNRVVHAREANQGETKQGILNLSEELLDLTPDEYASQMSMNPLAFEQCMMDLTRKAARQIFGRHFPYYTQLYNNMRELMGRLTKYGTLDAETVNGLHREMMVFLLSKQIGSKFDGSKQNETLKDYPMPNREYYTRQFPIILEALKSEGVLDNVPFFQVLKVSGDENATDRSAIKITVPGMGGLQSRSSNLITEMWAEAYKSDATIHSVLVGRDFTVRQLAEDFYFYNFYRLGYNFHPTSSMSLAPTLLKLGLTVDTDAEGMGYIDFIRKVIDGGIHMNSGDLIPFAKQYAFNHTDNNKFWFTPKGKTADKVLKAAYPNDVWMSSFEISLRELGDDTASIFTMKDKALRGNKITAYRPFLILEKTVNGKTVTAYYMADSKMENGQFNHTYTEGGILRYKQVYPQGIKGQQIQYFTNSDYVQFQNNGRLETSPRMSFQSMLDRANSEEGATADKAPEGAYISLNQNAGSTFTDSQWTEMIKAFRRSFPSITQGMENSDIKRALSDTSEQSNVDILNSLAEIADKGGLETIDENGKIIKVC